MGEPCAPYRIVRVRHGTQRMVEHVQGRKHPLLDIRRQALTDHFQYMRLQKRETILAASRVELEGLVARVQATCQRVSCVSMLTTASRFVISLSGKTIPHFVVVGTLW